MKLIEALDTVVAVMLMSTSMPSVKLALKPQSRHVNWKSVLLRILRYVSLALDVTADRDSLRRVLRDHGHIPVLQREQRCMWRKRVDDASRGQTRFACTFLYLIQLLGLPHTAAVMLVANAA